MYSYFRKRACRSGQHIGAVFLGLALSMGSAMPSKGDADGASAPLPKGHSAWVYDIVNRPGLARKVDPGYFAVAINDYNRQTPRGQQITNIFSYFGSMEMYCRHGRCPVDKLILSEVNTGAKGGERRAKSETLAGYQRAVSSAGDDNITVSAVIDGVVNADYAGSLRGFNELPRAAAEAFADKVSERICSDPDIDAVQFDIEPFDVSSKNGQYYFYRKIAANFSNTQTCGDVHHPNGRHFSIFAAGRHLRPGTESAENLQAIIQSHDNAYVIVPLYDLGSGALGALNPVDTYRQEVEAQTRQFSRWAKDAGIHYQYAIPAAASVHEYAGCKGKSCKDQHRAPASQLDYVKVAISAINASGAKENPYYLGTALWAWTRGIVHGGSEFSPSTPPNDVISYLQQHL